MNPITNVHFTLLVAKNINYVQIILICLESAFCQYKMFIQTG